MPRKSTKETVKKVAEPRSKSITDFLEEDFQPAALYLNYRTTPSCIDGLKNSHRKIVYAVRKLNKKDYTKVSQLAPLISAETDYLHGETSLMGAVVTLAQDYTGSNNLPLLIPNGNFGTRHMNSASAPRYIFTMPQPYFDLVFRKEDDKNLVKQIFEGGEIEPRFYVPIVPLLLVNGCVGIGVGFSSKVLARPLENMIEAIKLKLDKKKIPSELFVPNWNGFTGKVESLGNNKWSISGVAKKTGKHVEITELPISYDLMTYRNELKKLKEKGLVSKFTDLSEDDKFLFDVVLSPDEFMKSDEQIFSDLKLTDTFTESLVCLDENNALKEFDSAQDVFDKYFDVMIEYLQKRIASEIARLEKEAKDLKEIHEFVQDVIEGRINLKLKRADVEEKMKSRGYTIIDRLLAMPLYSITEEKAIESKEKYEAKEKELEDMRKQTPSKLWKSNLNELQKAIAKVGK